MTVAKAELIVDARAEIGEGPSWDARKSILYWVDILKGHIHAYDPATRNDTIISVEGFATSVVPSADEDSLVFTAQHGFFRLDLRNHEISKIWETELDMPDNRFNDGKCDTRGRLWAGTMSMKEEGATGSVYRLEGSRAEKIFSGVTISNGLGWSPDNSTMYYIDTPTLKVSAFDYDIDAGTIAGRRTIIDFSGQEGMPDGMSVDAEGMLWIADWGGFRVSRWDPRTGKQLTHIEVPVPNASSCCFGGKGLDELYITTAAKLSPDLLRKYPQSGGLYRARPGVKGLPTNHFP